MIELLILAVIVIAILGVLLFTQTRGFASEREEWRAERRFLIDRAIAQHVGEVIALEREDARKQTPTPEKQPERVLIEGLS